MTHGAWLRAAGLIVLAAFGSALTAQIAYSADDVCVDCLQVRVGPPVVVRGPFPDELDAPFTALKLANGTFRTFSANGSTYAIGAPTLWDMAGPRQEVLKASAPDSAADCGRWLTSTTRSGDMVIGLVHQEHACDYNQGRTEKSMAIATSSDDGLSWTDLGTVLTGRDLARGEGTTGEGDCTMVDGFDSYLYAYCIRASDWQTIVARAPIDQPTAWQKYYEGAWSEPGLGGNATAIGFLGPGAGYLRESGWIAAVATDPWFGGVRLSLSEDKVSFADLKEPLLPIDGSEWNRPADTGLIAYSAIVNPDDGSNVVGQRFLLSYVYVPPGLGFESRYLVHQEVVLTAGDTPVATQVGIALARWFDPERQTYVTSTGPLTGDRAGYRRDTVVAYLMTSAPEGIASVKLAECSSEQSGHLDQMLAEDGRCEPGFARERTAGWLYSDAQAGAVPLYRCIDETVDSHFASNAADCEGRGKMEFLLGYGVAP